MTDEPELYVPRPGSNLWKVLSYLIEHPTTELQRKDLVEKFGIAYNSVDMVMQLATGRGALNRKRNSANQVVWMLGLIKRFRLDPLPTEIHIPNEQPEAVIAKGVPASKWSASTHQPGPAHFQIQQQPAKPRPPVIIPAAPPADQPAKSGPVSNKVIQLATKIIGICNFNDTVMLATETGAFMYDAVKDEFKPIRFATK